MMMVCGRKRLFFVVFLSHSSNQTWGSR
jgi:hypothetical protein